MPSNQKHLNWNEALIPQVKEFLLSEIDKKKKALWTIEDRRKKLYN